MMTGTLHLFGTGAGSFIVGFVPAEKSNPPSGHHLATQTDAARFIQATLGNRLERGEIDQMMKGATKEAVITDEHYQNYFELKPRVWPRPIAHRDNVVVIRRNQHDGAAG